MHLDLVHDGTERDLGALFFIASHTSLGGLVDLLQLLTGESAYIVARLTERNTFLVG